MVFTKEDRILMKILRQSKGYTARKLLEEFPDKDWSRSALDRLLRQTDTTGSADRKSSSGRKHTVCTRDNIDDVELLVVSQEDAPGTHRTIRQVARNRNPDDVGAQNHSQGPETSVLKKRRAQELTEANKIKRLVCVKQLLRKYPEHAV